MWAICIVAAVLEVAILITFLLTLFRTKITRADYTGASTMSGLRQPVHKTMTETTCSESDRGWQKQYI